MRKIFGIILLILGYLIALLATLSLVSQIFETPNKDMFSLETSSFIVGTLIGFALLGGIAYFLIRTGIKLTQKKKVDNILEKIESIK